MESETAEAGNYVAGVAFDCHWLMGHSLQKTEISILHGCMYTEFNCTFVLSMKTLRMQKREYTSSWR